MYFDIQKENPICPRVRGWTITRGLIAKKLISCEIRKKMYFVPNCREREREGYYMGCYPPENPLNMTSPVLLVQGERLRARTMICHVLRGRMVLLWTTTRTLQKVSYKVKEKYILVKGDGS